jgi:hypothetical protein
MTEVIFSTDRPRGLSSSDGACSLVVIVSANLNTIEGDGFVEADYSR